MVGSRRLTSLGASVVERVSRFLGNDRRPLLVALSGGADSAVLAWAIQKDAREARAIHVHHGWPDSDRMEAAAVAVADHLDIEMERVRVDAVGPGSPEGEARRARYQAVRRIVREGELIATGHTLTEQAETVLGNLIWGSGLDGLRGIHRRRNNLVRPLIEVSRAETRELACLLGIPFGDDPANYDVAFRRVRIRRALAEWERQLAPGMAVRLADVARLVEGDLGLLEQFSAGQRIEQADGAVRIPAPILRTLPPALGARVVRRGLRALGGGHPGTRRDVDTVLRAARDGTPGWVGGGHLVTRAGSYVQIGSSPPIADGPLGWSILRPVRWGEWTWEASQFNGRPDSFPFTAWRQVFDGRVFAGEQPVIRRPVPDDRIAMRIGHKRVLDAMAEAGMTAADRSEWPLLEVGGRVVWIPGVRRAYAGWVTADTMSYVLLSATREATWRPVGY
ncbi:MAG: tRNA lysidine(34) synthetase TilS [bacterium]|nr:tRNA lysidine(34) synthetase TilS [bacterium]